MVGAVLDVSDKHSGGYFSGCDLVITNSRASGAGGFLDGVSDGKILAGDSSGDVAIGQARHQAVADAIDDPTVRFGDAVGVSWRPGAIAAWCVGVKLDKHVGGTSTAG